MGNTRRHPQPAASASPRNGPGKTCHQPGPLTDLHLEIVEGVLIDVLHLLHEPHGVVGKGSDVGAAHLIIGAGIQPRSSHVGATNRLDLLQLPEPLLADDLDRTEGPGCQGRQAKPSPASSLNPCHALAPFSTSLAQHSPPFGK